MKLLAYIFVLFTIQVSAQKETYQEIAYTHQEVDIQFLNVDLVEFVHTDNPKITITMRDYAENSTNLIIGENSRIITINTFITPPFQQNVKTEKYCYVQPLFPSFKIAIPEGCVITVNYNKGNFKATGFKGNMNLSLDTGNVEIDILKGKINAELLSGNMNISFKNAAIDVQSNKGKIQTNFPTASWKKTETSLKGVCGNDLNKIKVLTVNANIIVNTTRIQ